MKKSSSQEREIRLNRFNDHWRSNVMDDIYIVFQSSPVRLNCSSNRFSLWNSLEISPKSRFNFAPRRNLPIDRTSWLNLMSFDGVETISLPFFRFIAGTMIRISSGYFISLFACSCLVKWNGRSCSSVVIMSFFSLLFSLSHWGTSMITARLSSWSSTSTPPDNFNRNKFNSGTHTLDWRLSNACHSSSQTHTHTHSETKWKWLHQSVDPVDDHLPCSFVLHARLSSPHRFRSVTISLIGMMPRWNFLRRCDVD